VRRKASAQTFSQDPKGVDVELAPRRVLHEHIDQLIKKPRLESCHPGRTDGYVWPPLALNIGLPAPNLMDNDLLKLQTLRVLINYNLPETAN